MEELIKHAAGYAKLGCAVFPCHLDKTPMTPHGFKDATTDRATVLAWWTEHPQASIGIACGASGWLVLDIDGDKGGFESFAELRDRDIITSDDLHTFTTRTGGGGMHIAWKQPEGVKIGNSTDPIRRLLGLKAGDVLGLDIRGEGGYIIAPPSGHPSGNLYQIEINAKPQPAPERLVDLLTEIKKPKAEFTAGPINPKGAIKSAISKVAQAPKGERNNVLSNQAWFLLHLVKDGSIPRNIAEDALRYAGQGAGLTEREIQATLISKSRLVLGA
jgi:bifunctional DNA-binding transcriptional regulator/antitoxin component of YhaV-PrlF toxin-antitoxin module